MINPLSWYRNKKREQAELEKRRREMYEWLDGEECQERRRASNDISNLMEQVDPNYRSLHSFGWPLVKVLDASASRDTHPLGTLVVEFNVVAKRVYFNEMYVNAIKSSAVFPQVVEYLCKQKYESNLPID